ncbi:MAG: hypothetical protein EB084_20405 [Proteobacteria bacterium]|nr:hypothetical protein [Pseudomonadota bacterium]
MVKDDHGLWRELGYPRDDRAQSVRSLQVACTCGWRSPRLEAPPRTRYEPFTVELERDEDREKLADLWEAHVRELVPRRRAAR